MKFYRLLLPVVIALIFGCATPNEPATDSGQLQIQKLISTYGYAFDFDLADEILFIAQDQRGFSIHNYISGSEYVHQEVQANGNPFENVRHIAGSISDNFMLVYDRYGSPANFAVYDVSNLFDPQYQTTSISNTSNVQMVKLDMVNNQRQIYWTNGSSFNIATYTTNWINDLTLNFPNSVNGFDYDDNLLVVAGYQYGIYFVDRDTNEILGTYNTVGEALDVKLVDNLLFAALWAEGFLILDISDLAKPQKIYQKNIGDNIYKIDVKDDYLLLSSHIGGVFLYNIEDITEPELVGNLRRSDMDYTYSARFHEENILASTRKGIYVLSY
jgi:hypothetical protein